MNEKIKEIYNDLSALEKNEIMYHGDIFLAAVKYAHSIGDYQTIDRIISKIPINAKFITLYSKYVTTYMSVVVNRPIDLVRLSYGICSDKIKVIVIYIVFWSILIYGIWCQYT